MFLKSEVTFWSHWSLTKPGTTHLKAWDLKMLSPPLLVFPGKLSYLQVELTMNWHQHQSCPSTRFHLVEKGVLMIKLQCRVKFFSFFFFYKSLHFLVCSLSKSVGRTRAASPLSVSRVLQGWALASRQASGPEASLRVAGNQIGLRHTQLWPRGCRFSRRSPLNLPWAILSATVSDYVCVSTIFVC